jgi:hypothetical protein
MFVQHKQLKSLKIPATKVAHLHSTSSSVQLSFAEHFPQLCQAYLIRITGGDKTLIVVAFYLTESQCSIFFVPQFGEVLHHLAEEFYEEGRAFIESMGFELNETDYHLIPEQEKQSYWGGLPICQLPGQAETPPSASVAEIEPDSIQLRSRSLKSLGRFFASM